MSVPAFLLSGARDLVNIVAPEPGEHVLDVACGTGAVTRLIVERDLLTARVWNMAVPS